MGTVGFARTTGALFFASVILLGSPAMLAASPSTIGSAATATTQQEPFGLSASPIGRGALSEKWLGVEQAVQSERAVIDACRQDRSHCASPATLQFLALADRARARDGLARIGEINRAINLGIRPVSDLANYGVEDYWSAPLATLAKASGDCEDYAIAKYYALQEAGIAPSELRLVIVRDIKRDQDHAVVAAHFEGRWLILDNRWLPMLADDQTSDYRPTFVIDENGVRAYAPRGDEDRLIAENTENNKNDDALAMLIVFSFGFGSQ